jgi:hypothetical protein
VLSCCDIVVCTSCCVFALGAFGSVMVRFATTVPQRNDERVYLCLQFLEAGEICRLLLNRFMGETNLSLIQLRIMLALSDLQLVKSEPTGISVGLIASVLESKRPRISKQVRTLLDSNLVKLDDFTCRTSGYVLTKSGSALIEELRRNLLLADREIRIGQTSKNWDFLVSKLTPIVNGLRSASRKRGVKVKV